ncbi:MAG: ABC transporter ATP-binding protein [Candidatus Spechtbacterales bacterium]
MSILEVQDLTVAFPFEISGEGNQDSEEYIFPNKEGFFKKTGSLKKVLHSVSFEMSKGEVLGLVGESGSGKSMTSLAVTRLLPDGAVVADGKILFEGVDLLKLSDKEMRERYRGKRISTIFQDAKGTFVPSRAIGPQIAEMLVMHEGMKKNRAKEGAIELLREANVSNSEESYDKIISELSGGEAQRASIAMMALSTKPDLLIADEATTALDVTVQKKTLDYLIKVVREKGISLLFITHDFGLVAEYADRVVVLDKGKVVESGDVEQVFYSPRSAFLKDVMSNLLRVDESLREKSQHNTKTDKVVNVSNMSVSFSISEPVSLFKQITHVNRAVVEVSLNLHKGEILGIVGESGSGKTTLMRGILNILPDRADIEGSVYVFDKDMHSLSEKELLPIRKKITGVPQSSAQGLTPGKRVRDIIGEPLDIHGLYESKTPYGRYAEKENRVAQLLEVVGLPPERANEVVGRFSGGEQQRIAIASALATSPDVLILDEPTASLDASRKRTILELLIKLHKERNLSYIVISHELATIAAICDRVAVMWKGRIVEMGMPEQVFKTPEHPYTKRLINSIPIPDPRLAREREPVDDEIKLYYELSDSVLTEVREGHFVAKQRL